MSTSFKASLMVLALLAGIGGWVWQRQRADGLRHAIAGLRQETSAVSHQNARLKRLIAHRNEPEAAKLVREEIEKQRMELASLEAQWRRMTAAPPKRPRYDHFTANWDPEKGPVRVKHFRNQGQATPSAAFQTVVWALATDASDALLPLLGISPAGHAKLDAIAARMTPETPTRYRRPEKIVGTILAFEFLEEEGFEIAGTSEPDWSGQVVLRVRPARSGRKNLTEKRFPFRRGPTGWQLTVTDKMIDEIPAKLEQASMYVPPRGPAN